MPQRFLLLPIALLGVSACTPMTSSTARLGGQWRTSPLPSGSGIDLSLVTSGTTVTGTGHQYVLQYLTNTFTIVGNLDPDRSAFRLTLTSDTGAVVTYTAHIVGADELQGEWAPLGCRTTFCQSESITFLRATQ